jgi:hypothetical protein
MSSDELVQLFKSSYLGCCLGGCGTDLVPLPRKTSLLHAMGVNVCTQNRCESFILLSLLHAQLCVLQPLTTLLFASKMESYLSFSVVPTNLHQAHGLMGIKLHTLQLSTTSLALLRCICT